jgi:hypothetical protein
MLAEELGKKTFSQPEVLFLPLNLGAKCLFTLVLKEIGNSSHFKSSSKADGINLAH